MKTLIISLIGIFQLQLIASADAPYCAISYRADSFGMGIESGFRQVNVMPKRVDIGCYNLGWAEGERLRSSYEYKCAENFNAGYSEGFSVTNKAGSQCFSFGYMAGHALLGSGVREKNEELVGRACINAYDRGYIDGKSNIAKDIPQNNQTADCYWMGFTDYSVL